MDKQPLDQELDLPRDMSNVFAYIARRISYEFAVTLRPVIRGKPTVTIHRINKTWRVVASAGCRTTVTAEQFRELVTSVLRNLDEELSLHDEHLGFATVIEESVYSSSVVLEVAERL